MQFTFYFKKKGELDALSVLIDLKLFYAEK